MAKTVLKIEEIPSRRPSGETQVDVVGMIRVGEGWTQTVPGSLRRSPSK